MWFIYAHTYWRDAWIKYCGAHRICDRTIILQTTLLTRTQMLKFLHVLGAHDCKTLSYQISDTELAGNNTQKHIFVRFMLKTLRHRTYTIPHTEYWIYILENSRHSPAHESIWMEQQKPNIRLSTPKMYHVLIIHINAKKSVALFAGRPSVSFARRQFVCMGKISLYPFLSLLLASLCNNI